MRGRSRTSESPTSGTLRPSSVSSAAASRSPVAPAASSSDTVRAARDRPRHGGVEQRRRAAVEDGLGGADGHDEVGVDERWM